MGSWKRLAPGRFGWALLLGVLVLAGGQALAQDDPPGRVGRIAMLQGAASVFDAELAQWVDATVNLPVTQHDRLVTGNDGQLELRIGSTTLYLDASTEVQAVRLDDERLQFALLRGSLALRVRAAEIADESEIVTPEGWKAVARTFRWRTATILPVFTRPRTSTPSPTRSTQGARMKTAWNVPAPSTSTSASNESTWRPNALRRTVMSSAPRQR